MPEDVQVENHNKADSMNIPAISVTLLRFFRRIVRGYFHRHFTGVRVSGASKFVDNGRPLIVYANHSSWWDPMVSILLADSLMPERSHFAPMDSEALARYGILRKVGIFPVDIGSSRGAVQFLRAGAAVLEQGGVLWVTPQGKFVDARARPLVFKPGLAALAVRVSAVKQACDVLPLAIEYTFWNERLPEVLLHFGNPVQVVPGETVDSVQSRLIDALEATMEKLCQMTIGRNAADFTTLSRGRLGVGGMYGLGKRLKAIASWKTYQPEHNTEKCDAVTRSKDID